jgi:hypothetical protein
MAPKWRKGVVHCIMKEKTHHEHIISAMPSASSMTGKIGHRSCGPEADSWRVEDTEAHINRTSTLSFI